MSWLLKQIPAPYRWLALVGLVAAFYGYAYMQGVEHEQDKAERAAAAQTAASNKALLDRNESNRKLLEKQRATNLEITKAKDEQIARLRADAFLTDRMRLPAFCGSPAGPAIAPGPASGDPGAAERGLLPRSVQEDIQALILEVEQATATGRACQSFLTANGLVP